MHRYTCTAHAIQRWRERAALYGNETVHDVTAAAQEAQIVQTTALPFPAKPNTTYLYHATRQLYFVVEPVSADEGRIVTVFTATTSGGPPVNFPS